MKSIASLGILGIVTALFLLALPVQAHHGWDGNDKTQFELTGTIEQDVSLAGPHATMKIRSGNQVWDITLAPPARTERAGLRPGVLPAGAQVTVSGHRNKDPKKFEIKTERVTYNGQVFNVYPDRE